MSVAGTQKKRSRFAKPVNADRGSDQAVSDYLDDYMAPLETLLPEAEFQVKEKQADHVPKQRKVTLKELMDESREKGLAAPIDSANTGFKLLKKFGYKEGEGLGKEGNGTIIPVELSKRTSADASGLGVLEKQVRKEKAIQAMKAGKKTLVESLERNFRNDQMQQRAQGKRLRDMRKAQKVIYELDEAAGVAVHRLTASLHQLYIDGACGGSGGDVHQPDSRVRQSAASENRMEEGDVQFAYGHMLSDRIADRCDGSDDYSGGQGLADGDSGSEEDSDSGTRRARGRGRNEGDSGDAYRSGSEEAHWNRAAPLEEEDVTLEDCLAYLRDTYNYCYYCGVRYHDKADLETSCPGETEDDH